MVTREKTVNFISKTLLLFSIIFASVLVLSNILVTVSVDYTGHYFVHFLRNTILLLAVLSILGLFACYFKMRQKDKNQTTSFGSLIYLIVFLVVFLFSFVWIIIANSDPAWDSEELLRAANAFLGSKQPLDIAEWASNGYVNHFPFQTPLIIFFSFVIWLFGSHASFVLQIINCVCNSVSCVLILKITDKLFSNCCSVFITFILSSAFIGLFLYSTFVYGNLLSIPFFLISVLSVTTLFSSADSFTNFDAFICTACLVVSVLFKSTMKIALIAFVILFIVKTIATRNIKFLIYAILPWVISSILLNICVSFCSSKFNVDYTQNNPPSSSWVVMGIGASNRLESFLQNNPSLSKDLSRPGWYDSYVWTDVNSLGYSGFSELNRKLINEQIVLFVNDPAYFVHFFVKKFLCLWSEPTFEGFLASNWDSGLVPENTRSNRDYRPLAHSCYYGYMNKILVFIGDFFQSAVSIGFLMGLIVLSRNQYQKTLLNCLPLILFTLGGAFLYMFWEMKSQYIFIFYLTMIPIASFGWERFVTYLVEIHLNKFVSVRPRLIRTNHRLSQ